MLFFIFHPDGPYLLTYILTYILHSYICYNKNKEPYKDIVSSVRSSSGYHGLLRTYILDNDYAILRLSQPVYFTDKVSPACLPDNWENTYADARATATGWGATDRPGGSLANTLQKADVRVISNDECKVPSAEDWTGQDWRPSKNMICTAGSGEGICTGDSGGPLAVRENGRHAVVCTLPLNKKCWKSYGGK